ncbi:unnamed protein product [Paramecium sonneborni]|uniref:WD40-repeat-containing domain n=1 Tax=Paramecium sonneborni TaxID=65129 RepID=A0A8S1MMK9_9CILI|nr:unnamed protein product [Paramecium sonneborni]
MHKEQIRCISFNESQNYLISCGDDNLINIYKLEKINKQWTTIQQIKVDQCGYRLCFIGENQFVFQPRCSAKLEVYQYYNDDYKYKKILEQQVQTSQYCNHLFPQKWVKSKSILLNKAGNYLNVIKVHQNGQFLIEQVIDFGTACFYGTISEDGNDIITWDYESNQIQIRRNSLII